MTKIFSALLLTAVLLTLPGEAYADGTAPVAQNLELCTYKNVTVSGKLSAFDSENDVVMYEITTPPVKGSVELCDDGSFTFYFHGAQAGRKYELSQQTPTVGFEIDGGYRPVAGDTACAFTAEFQSVIGTGVLRLLSDRQEKIAGLNAVMRQLSGRDGWDYPDAMVDSTAVYCLQAKTLSCKAKQ